HAGAHQASRATGAADPDCGPRARPTRRASAAWTAFAPGVGPEGTGRARWTRPASGQVALGHQRAGRGAAGAPGRCTRDADQALAQRAGSTHHLPTVRPARAAAEARPRPRP